MTKLNLSAITLAITFGFASTAFAQENVPIQNRETRDLQTQQQQRSEECEAFLREQNIPITSYRGLKLCKTMEIK